MSVIPCKNDLKIDILTEAGRKRGLGHVIRCVAIYEAFLEVGISPNLYVDLRDNIDIKNYQYKDVKWLKKIDFILKELKNADIVIIDSYEASKEFYYEAAKRVKLPVYIDDFRRIEYPRGVIVNFSLYANKLFKEKDIRIHKYLLGNQYIPIRKEFLDFSESNIDTSLEVSNILIMLGGTDFRDLSLKILNLLSKNEYLAIRKTLVSGTERIEDSSLYPNTQFLTAPSIKMLIDAMLDADIVISAAGMTLYELAYLKKPTIAVAVVKNQRKGLREFVKRGFLHTYIEWHRNLEEDIEDIFEYFFHNISELRKKALIGRQIVDGLGSRRIVEEVLREYKRVTGE